MVPQIFCLKTGRRGKKSVIWMKAGYTVIQLLVSTGKERENLVFKKLECSEQINTAACRKQKKGFLDNAMLGAANGGYHRQMNRTNFEK
jgi:hypothetical protein